MCSFSFSKLNFVFCCGRPRGSPLRTGYAGDREGRPYGWWWQINSPPCLAVPLPICSLPLLFIPAPSPCCAELCYANASVSFSITQPCVATAFLCISFAPRCFSQLSKSFALRCCCLQSHCLGMLCRCVSFHSNALSIPRPAMPMPFTSVPLRRTAIPPLIRSTPRPGCPALRLCRGLLRFSFAVARHTLPMLCQPKPLPIRADNAFSEQVFSLPPRGRAMPSVAMPLQCCADQRRYAAERILRHVQACDASPFRGRASLCYSLAARVYSTPLPSVGRRCNSFAPRSKADARLFRCGFDGRLFRERNNNIAVMFCESRVKRYANVTSEACTSAGFAFCEIFTSGRVPARFCADARGLCLFAAYVALCGEFARRV